MAASNIASTGIVLEALTKDNYDNWSTLVKNYLVGKGLWYGIIEFGPQKPNGGGKEDDWRSKNAKALHAIQLACGSDNLSNIRTFENATEAWNHLSISFSNDVTAYPDDTEEQEPDDFVPKPEPQAKSQSLDISTLINKLHSDVKQGRWDLVKSSIERHGDDARLSTTASLKRTILHVAVAFRREKIVKELVYMDNKQLLWIQDKRGYTALALAAELTDNKVVAKCMIEKGGKELLMVKTKDHGDGEIPLLIAAAKGHKQMTRYLFSQTPIHNLFENKGREAAVLLTRCISAEIFDIAASLLQDHRPIDLTNETKELRPINALVHIPSAFLSAAQLTWWQRLIYNCLRLQTSINLHGIINIVVQGEPDQEADTKTSANLSATHHPGRIFKPLCRRLRQFKDVIPITPILRKLGGEKTYQMKLNHHLALKILKQMSETVSKCKEPRDLSSCSAYDSMLLAAKYGIVEFIESMRNANNELLWAVDKNKRGIFSHAISYRKEKVFNLMLEIEEQKEKIVTHEDVLHNNMLHIAAELGPSSYLSSISNPALQMQREYQWFKAVEKIVPPKFKEARNADGKKPHELFSKTHQELMKAGEKWARDTATSFTIVGTLIITMMFAAAITVPGGNDQNTGTPIFLKKRAFTVFILADAISLVTSSSSVLIFIWILTSRYAEKDFLLSLPLKILSGLITLFFSVTSMMISFVAALSMMLKGYRGVVIAAIVLAFFPVVVLIPTLLKLSLEIALSTWRWRSSFLALKKKKIHQD